MPALAVLGYGGGLLHVINHRCSRDCCFWERIRPDGAARARLTASAACSAACPDGNLFLVGAAGHRGSSAAQRFVSEFLIYLAAFGSLAGEGQVIPQIPGLVAIGALG